jgi:elongation factor P hydroxylase
VKDVEIAALFNARFEPAFATILAGGADEPSYLPAAGTAPAVIRYREDYAASALHEIAHWCIAGAARRRLPDYGYWYLPPPRDRAGQEAFYGVERRVQALECLLAAAAGVPFAISADNLEIHDVAAFRQAVADEVRRTAGALPLRAAIFLDDLAGAR